MERVVTINLNGNPYQLEEPAYDAVRAYLTRAEAALADNPDKAEVVRDLEQAIADKCASYLSPVKTVIAAAEMAKILDEMGPVEGEAAADNAQASATSTGGARPRRLYRIRDGAQIAGVCAGLGAYFDIDVNWMRVLFLIATVLTSGFFILVYIAMMFIIPSANTSEEWAAAHGVPFNAQEVIDRAKREYQHFAANGPPWTWPRWQRRQWKREMRARWRSYRWGGWQPSYASAAPAPGPVSYSFGLLTGLLGVVLAFVRALLFIIFIAFLFALVTTGSLGYWALPPHMALWQAIVGLILIYVLISIPLRAMRWALYSGHPYYGYRGAEALTTLAVIVVVALVAYNSSPEARHVMDNIPEALRQFGAAMANAFKTTVQPLID
ncbi:MAG: PspC domain-containing protein [Proteobacteria bacterium]|nr:PspC domain-containing protein [Pseudomonadota bacterium]